MYIVELPNEWYLREYMQGRFVPTGDPDRATRFPTETDANKALAQSRHSVKAAAIKGAKIVKVFNKGVDPQ